MGGKFCGISGLWESTSAVVLSDGDLTTCKYLTPPPGGNTAIRRRIWNRRYSHRQHKFYVHVIGNILICSPVDGMIVSLTGDTDVAPSTSMTPCSAVGSSDLSAGQTQCDYKCQCRGVCDYVKLTLTSIFLDQWRVCDITF